MTMKTQVGLVLNPAAIAGIASIQINLQRKGKAILKRETVEARQVADPKLELPYHGRIGNRRKPGGA